jgi:hypothetical protein
MASGALSESEQVAVVHLVRSIMAQTPPNMDVAQAMPLPLPAHLASKDCPANVMGIARALTNIIAALAVDPSSPVAYANAGYGYSSGVPKGDTAPPLLINPSSMCSPTTAQLVPLLQPIIFSAATDRVFSSTAGLSGRYQQQLECFRRRDVGW